jgi:hypothetical protein
MAAWMSRIPAWMSAFWEDTGRASWTRMTYPARLVLVPQARQAFLADFG